MRNEGEERRGLKNIRTKDKIMDAYTKRAILTTRLVAFTPPGMVL